MVSPKRHFFCLHFTCIILIKLCKSIHHDHYYNNWRVNAPCHIDCEMGFFFVFCYQWCPTHQHLSKQNWCGNDSPKNQFQIQVNSELICTANGTLLFSLRLHYGEHFAISNWPFRALRSFSIFLTEMFANFYQNNRFHRSNDCVKSNKTACLFWIVVFRGFWWHFAKLTQHNIWPDDLFAALSFRLILANIYFILVEFCFIWKEHFTFISS